MTETNITKSVLSNGLTVITENVPGATSTAVGVFVLVGSIHEKLHQTGIAHFLEHLVFKGSKKRSSFNIVDMIESKGGTLNAFTEKDITTYVARVLPRDVLTAIDVLCDMILNPDITESKIQQEKTVIFEEINDFIDNPQDYVNESFIRKLYPQSSYGTFILGDKKSISELTHKDILTFHHLYYIPSNMMIVLSGAVNEDEIIPFLEKHVGVNTFNAQNIFNPIVTGIISRGLEWEEKDDIEQSHVIYGRHFPDTDKFQKYCFHLIQLLLSEGMSSRLFQHIREKYGFVYTIESFMDTFGGCGVFGVYAGTNPSKRYDVRTLIQQEMIQINEKQITNAELKRIRMQFEGQLIIQMENPENRMERIAHHFINYGHYLSPLETINYIHKIDKKDLSNAMRCLQNFEEYNTFFLIPRNAT
ncbi:MAG: pitrilysin family protein [Candidatus Marinimicrobia bacterium]|nr:pitrilysin family protein [Candidatus Neomarinimicrobiota bacterium]MDD5582949.1 pitrilysin family protein [Candidatus Neomarinimicrobiota bacterium]